MQKSKNAFTMIELIFVIVILGILAAVALPKLAVTRDDAQIAKARSTISSIRSAIVTERQTRLIRGDSSWISKLSTGNAADNLFTGVDVNQTLLTYGISSDKWALDGAFADPVDSYTYTLGQTTLDFTYNNTTGRFTCSTTAGNAAQNELCKSLIN